jgi:hypothetical protein
MSYASEKVKLWRKNNKIKIVEAMGGKCVCCGYKKSTEALSLHHLDPSSKDISFKTLRSNPMSWNKMVIELRKCVLVCSNCHMEIHAGITNIPKNYERFNEKYAITKEKYDLCPVCGNQKKIYSKTCSYSCAGKLARKLNWDNIDIENELKTKSMAQLARELDISDTAIRKRLNKLSLTRYRVVADNKCQ